MQASSSPEVNSRQLRAVLAVAEYRSFIAAAAFLKTSQPALTRTIKQIEGALGASLFSRSTRQVSITEAGKEFVALAERLLNDLKIGVENVRELAEQRRGQITVASIMSLAHVALPRIIAEYNRHFPGIEIHLREGVQGNVQDDVRSGLADFGLGYVADMPEFTTESLGTEAFYVVLPSRHRLTRAKEIELKALKDATLVSLSTDSRTRRIIDGAAATAGFTFRHAVTVNQFATLYSFVRNGVGLTVVPEGARPPAHDPELVSRQLIRPRVSREIGIVRLRGRELTPAAAGLLALVKERLRRPRRLRFDG